ncbi:hypothetical protein DRH27_02270 [Candidatus Falkowbacteria bacterium]|nr:MAG: hypothetical protein DRH27_02270 [Candidatus Falkowbacteria bacterium]
MANLELSIVLAKDNYVVQSGKSTYIQAIVKGWIKPKEKILLWSAEKGSVDKNGKYIAPVVNEDDVDVVTVCCAEDRAVEESIGIQIVFTESTDEFVQIGEIKPIGLNGRYAINIQCLNKKQFGHKCSIIITDYDQEAETILPDATYTKEPSDSESKPAPGVIPIRKWSEFQIQVKTSKMGFVSIHLKPFTEKIRKLHVRIKGSTIDREIILKGPKPKIELKKGAGFWANALQI